MLLYYSMEPVVLFNTLLYLLLLTFFGYMIGCYLSEPHIVREGARTLPRPVIDPITKEQILDIQPLPPYFGETLNQLIDKYISDYFDKRGYPYIDTIDRYSTLCIENPTDGKLGVITEENKRKLTDIGYYFINIVIPNIQTIDNPRPDLIWPPIRWTGNATFTTQVQPTATYKIYKGQAWSSYGNDLDGVSKETIDYSLNSGTQDDSNTDTTSGGGDGGGSGSGSGSGNGGCQPDSDCRIACPGSCLDGIASAWEETDKARTDAASTSYTTTSGEPTSDTYSTYSQNTNNLPGVSSLKGGSNVLIIGDVEVDGFQTTDIDVDPSITIFNDHAVEFINKYFIASGPNQGRPTQLAIDEFNLYFKGKAPMDGIHMNKMRDVVYYILQSIIPGLPTRTLPRAYVEWRPIHWLSRSEPKTAKPRTFASPAVSNFD